MFDARKRDLSISLSAPAITGVVVAILVYALGIAWTWGGGSLFASGGDVIGPSLLAVWLVLGWLPAALAGGMAAPVASLVATLYRNGHATAAVLVGVLATVATVGTAVGKWTAARRENAQQRTARAMAAFSTGHSKEWIAAFGTPDLAPQATSSLSKKIDYFASAYADQDDLQRVAAFAETRLAEPPPERDEAARVWAITSAYKLHAGEVTTLFQRAQTLGLPLGRQPGRTFAGVVPEMIEVGSKPAENVSRLLGRLRRPSGKIDRADLDALEEAIRAAGDGDDLSLLTKGIARARELHHFSFANVAPGTLDVFLKERLPSEEPEALRQMQTISEQIQSGRLTTADIAAAHAYALAALARGDRWDDARRYASLVEIVTSFALVTPRGLPGFLAEARRFGLPMLDMELDHVLVHGVLSVAAHDPFWERIRWHDAMLAEDLDAMQHALESLPNTPQTRDVRKTVGAILARERARIPK